MVQRRLENQGVVPEQLQYVPTHVTHLKLSTLSIAVTPHNNTAIMLTLIIFPASQNTYCAL